MTAYARDTDVVVVGAGMGGAAVSKRLSDAGLRIVCLEQGDWIHPLDHPHFLPEWEIERERGWSFDPNVRGLPEDYPVTGNVAPYMFNAVGGSTVHFGGSWPRFKPVDFRKGTEHGVAAAIDWPIAYEELEPFYDINDEETGISGALGDPASPPRSPRWGPPTRPGRLGLLMAEAFDRLGWHWWPADNAILTRPRDGRLACNYCGPCLSGCPRGSIGSADVTYWPKAIRNGVDLRVCARAEEVTVDSHGRATGVVYIDRGTGQRHRVRARIVVVCANAIGTPRLLLLSRSAAFPHGLGNSEGLVGRHLMFHGWSLVDCWFDEPVGSYKGNISSVLYCQTFYDTDVERGFVNGFSLQVGRTYGPAFAALGANTGAVVAWGQGHRAAFDERFGRQVLVYVQGEDLPAYENRVTLDDSESDSSGLPAARIEYQLHANDRRLLEYGTERAIEAAAATGNLSEALATGPLMPPPGWHMMGTCRMGGSARDSVTNMYNQTWDVPNLFVADASSLATGAAVNPTSTIGAVAVRCAEYIKRRFGDIERQRRTPTNNDAPGF